MAKLPMSTHVAKKPRLVVASSFIMISPIIRTDGTVRHCSVASSNIVPARSLPSNMGDIQDQGRQELSPLASCAQYLFLETS